MGFLRTSQRILRGPLAAEPGPSPWYLSTPGLTVIHENGPLAWRPAGKSPPLAGKTVLVDRSSNPLLVLDFYCWVRQFDGPRLLVWHQTKRAALERHSQAPALHLHVFDVNGLRSVPNTDAACRELDASPESVLWAGGHLDHRQLPVSIPAGTHEVDLPPAIRELGELFVLVDAATPGQVGPPSVRLWVVRPATGALQVIPQDWFNTGAFDFGYQWITRVARDPRTRRLVGEGIRLGPFALDETGTQVAEWLTVNPFEAGLP